MKASLLPALLLAALPAAANDSYYWSDQYGTIAELLSGAVVGSKVDISQTYYNPGAAALGEARSLIISGHAFQVESIKVKDGEGEGRNLGTFRGGVLPGFIAGTFPKDWTPDSFMAYSVLSRQHSSLELEQAFVGSLDVLPTSPGAESFAGSVLNHQSVDETWFGVTWGRAAGDHWGLGVTPYFAYRNQTTRVERVAEAVGAADSAAAVIIDQVSYWNLRALAKAGVLYDGDPFSAGLTVTTPGLNIFGSGSMQVNHVSNAQMTASVQEGLSSKFKSPLSVAAGASYKLGRTTLHAAAEWFDGVDPFRVVNASSFASQTSGEVFEPPTTYAADEVVNYSFGVAYAASERASYYGSFARNGSTFRPESQLTFSSWDTYQLMFGGALDFKRLRMTLGLGYEFGGGPTRRLVDFARTTGAGLDSPPSEPRTSYRRFKMIFGFAFGGGEASSQG